MSFITFRFTALPYTNSSSFLTFNWGISFLQSLHRKMKSPSDEDALNFSLCNHVPTLFWNLGRIFGGPGCWLVRETSWGRRAVLCPLTQPILSTMLSQSWLWPSHGVDAGSILPYLMNHFRSKTVLTASTFSPLYCECKGKGGL